jgi:hypothetical protein
MFSFLADLLNAKWHSIVNDVLFTIYKNREPSSQINHIVPDDKLWLTSVKDGYLFDYEFLDDDMLDVGKEELDCDESKINDLAEWVVAVTSKTILSPCFGPTSDHAVKDIRNIIEENYSPSPWSATSTVEYDSTPDEAEETVFKNENITTRLGNLSEDLRLKCLMFWKLLNIRFTKTTSGHKKKQEIFTNVIYPSTRKVLLLEYCKVNWRYSCNILGRCKKIDVLALSWIGYKEPKRDPVSPNLTEGLNIRDLLGLKTL